MDNCFMHDGGNGRSHDPPHNCGDRIGTDVSCGCRAGITPHSFEASDIQVDVPCGPP
ncbi:MAG: hypothetical protein ABSA92_01235 [Candidatus Bathyarchaeia archaeon]